MCGRDGLGAARYAELLVRPREQRLDGLLSHGQVRGYLTVRGAGREQPQDVTLARAERRPRGRGGWLESYASPPAATRRSAVRSSSTEPRLKTDPCAPASRAASLSPGSARAAMITAGRESPVCRSSRTSSVPRRSGRRWSTSSRSTRRRPRRCRLRRRRRLAGDGELGPLQRESNPRADDRVVLDDQDGGCGGRGRSSRSG